MSGKKYVPEGVYLVCDKGTKLSALQSFSYTETTLFGDHMCTKADKTVAVNFEPFGACACMNGNTCTAPVTDWTNLSTGILLGGNELLLENSELPCAAGGTIRIFYSKQAATATVPKPKKKWWQTAIEYAETYEEFKIGVAQGVWKGLKGTATGIWNLTKWASKHTTLYQLANPKGYAAQIQKDKETFTAMGNVAKKAGVWAYRSSGYNKILNPEDWKAQQVQNKAMLGKLADKASKMNAKQWGNLAGQVVFEVGMEVGTAGTVGAITAIKMADKAKDAANVIDALDDIQDTAKALETTEDIIGETKHLDMPEELGDVVYLDEAVDVVEDMDIKTFFNDEAVLRSRKAVREANIQSKFPYMSLEELASIYHYTTSSYYDLNRALRGVDSVTDNLNTFNKLLNKSLDKLPKYKKTTYRGVPLPESKVNKYKNAFENKIPITESSFISTSKSIDIAKSFTKTKKVNNKKVIFQIEGKNGVNIEDISKYGPSFNKIKNEAEIIFKSGSTFKVTQYVEKILENGEKYILIKLVE